MKHELFACSGGSIMLPDRRLTLVSRLDGGNLVVNPPREVWERSELTPAELTRWSFLVAAAGRAMIDALPQLDGGCVNYWEAGNWSLNDDAEPKGRKTARGSRRVHLHLLGRARDASAPSHRWGEAPMFPPFARRFEWAAGFEPLAASECVDIVTRVESALVGAYGMSASEISAWAPCARCGYPSTGAGSDARGRCRGCAAGD